MKSIKPNSKILTQAVVGGIGLSLPPGSTTPPKGMACVVLFVPAEAIKGMSPIEMQADMGIAWSGENGAPFWFPQNEGVD